MNPLDPLGGLFDMGFSKKLNPDVIEGLEQIENEQAYLDRKIYQNARRRIEGVEQKLSKLDARIATNINNRILTNENINSSRDATIISSLNGNLQTTYSQADIDTYCKTIATYQGLIPYDIAWHSLLVAGVEEPTRTEYARLVSTNPNWFAVRPNLIEVFQTRYNSVDCSNNPVDPPIVDDPNDFEGLNPDDFLQATACDRPSSNYVRFWLHKSIYPSGEGVLRVKYNLPNFGDHFFIWVPQNIYTDWGQLVGGLGGFINAKNYAALKCLYGSTPPQPPQPPLPPDEPTNPNPPVDPCLPCEPPIVVDPKPPIENGCCPVNVVVNVPQQPTPVVNVTVSPPPILPCEPSDGNNNNPSVHPITVNVPPPTVVIHPPDDGSDPTCGDRNELQYFLSECGQAELDAYFANLGFAEKYPLKSPVNYEVIKRASTSNGFNDLTLKVGE